MRIREILEEELRTEKKLLNETYEKEAFDKLQKATRIFKLNYRSELSEENLLGFKTYWEHIRSQL